MLHARYRRIGVVFFLVIVVYAFLVKGLYSVQKINSVSLEIKKEIVFFDWVILSTKDDTLREGFKNYVSDNEGDDVNVTYASRPIVSFIMKKHYYYKHGAVVQEMKLLLLYGKDLYDSNDDYEKEFQRIYKELNE